MCPGVLRCGAVAGGGGSSAWGAGAVQCPTRILERKRESGSKTGMEDKKSQEWRKRESGGRDRRRGVQSGGRGSLVGKICVEEEGV